MANNVTEIELDLDLSGLNKGLADGEKRVERFANEVVDSVKPVEKQFVSLGNTIAESSKKGFAELVKGVTVGNLVSDSIKGVAGAIVDFAKGSVTAAIEQQNAINQLSQALKASGSFSQQAVEDFAAFATQLQRTTVFGDEVVLSQIAVAKSFGATNENAKALVTAAANLSATFGGSLEENLTKLGKTLSGTAGRLGQFIPELKSLTKEQLAAGDAADIINQKFAGAAAAQTQTFSGTLTQLRNALSDVQEELGGIVTGSDLFRSGIKVATDSLNGFLESLSKSRSIQEANSEGFVQTESKLNDLSSEYAQVTAEIDKYNNIIARAGNPSFLDRDSIQLVNNARSELEKLTQQANVLFTQIESSSRAVKTAESNQPKGNGNNKVITDADAQKAEYERILKEKTDFEAEFTRIEADAKLLRSQTILDIKKSNPEIDPTKLLEKEIQATFDAEAAKIGAIKKAELAKAALIKDSNNRALAEKNANAKAEIALEINTLKAKKAAADEELRVKRLNQQVILSSTQNFLAAGLALTKQGSREQQALATANALVNTFQAATNALTVKPFLPLGLSSFSLALATGFGAIRNIQAQRFAKGGIVQGNTTRGDQIPARLNAEEMVLTKAQQAVLFNIANGRSSSSNNTQQIIEAIRAVPIIVEANGREIARLIRDEKNNGFAI